VAVADHIWTKRPPPWEYIEMILCRDVYHCRPSELRQEAYEDIILHLACLGMEREVIEANMREKKHGNK